jgi:hypothetical protein
MSREFTNKLNALIATGVLDQGYVLECALRWMSEADVAEMCTKGDLANTGLFDDEEEDEDEE